MDKDILSSLNNVASSLEILAKQLKEKNKENVDISKMSTNSVAYIQEIKANIEEIKSDNKKILKNQETLIETVKKQEQKKSIFSAMAGNGEDKSFVDNLKTGVGNILLIAGGILAIGAAFLLIGNVNFVSVMALGITLPLIAHAFSQIANTEHMRDPGSMLKVGQSLVIMSGIILASSYILQATRPVTPMQLITAVGLSGIFYIMAKGIGSIMSDSSLINLKSVGVLAMVPVIMATASASIVLSSHILQHVKPVAPVQLITSVGIAGMMYLVLHGVAKATQNIHGLRIADVLILPAIMVTSSLAIALSSYILRTVTPVGIPQLLTSLAIAGTFVVLAYAIGKVTKSIKDVNMNSLIATSVALPILMVGMSYAIMVSSGFLKDVQPISYPQFLTSVGIGITFISLAFAASLITKYGIDLKETVKIPLLMTTMSLAVFGASFYLQKVEPIPSSRLIDLILLTGAVSAATVIFSSAVFIISKMKISAKDIAIGALATVAVAGTIAASSQLLSMGSYGNVPSIEWAMGAGSGLLVFGLSTMALGLAIGLTGGTGAIALAAGAAATIVLAGVITASSHILSKGNYTGGPTYDWAKGTGLSLLAFGVSAAALGTIIIGTAGIGALALGAGSLAVIGIAKTIASASIELNKGSYTGGPTYEWAKSVSTSLGAFSSIYRMMLADSIMSKFGMGVSIDSYTDAIVNISKGIKTAALELNGVDYSGGPTYEWSRGVSLAIGAFTPVYERLGKPGLLSLITGSRGNVNEMNDAIIAICKSIVTAASFFNINKGLFELKGAPSHEWSMGVGNAISAFVPVFEFVTKNSGIFKGDAINKMQDSIRGVLVSLLTTDKILSLGKWNTNISENYINSLTRAIRSYINIDKELSGSDISGGLFKRSNIHKVSTDIVRLSNGIDKLVNSLGRLNNTIDVEKLNALKTVNGTFVMMSLMDGDSFSKVLSEIESKSGVYAKLLDDLNGDSSTNSDKLIRLPQQTIQQSSVTTNDNLYEVLVSIDRKLGAISDEMNSLSDFVTSMQSRNRIR